MDLDMKMVIVRLPDKNKLVLNISNDEICEKAWLGVKYEAENLNIFAEENGWRLSKSKLFDNIIYSSFEVVKNKHYFKYHCKSCEGLFNFPIDKSECIFCGKQELEKVRAKARYISLAHGRAGLTEQANPELVAAAQADLIKNPIPGSGADWCDWGYLEKEL